MSPDEFAAQLARVDERTAGIARDVAEMKITQRTQVKDHESRIRALERWFWRMSAVGGIGGAGGFAASWLTWRH